MKQEYRNLQLQNLPYRRSLEPEICIMRSIKIKFNYVRALTGLITACENGNQWLSQCSTEKTNHLPLNSFAIRKPICIENISPWSLCARVFCTLTSELITLFACSLEWYIYRQQQSNCLMIVTSLNPEGLSQWKYVHSSIASFFLSFLSYGFVRDVFMFWTETSRGAIGKYEGHLESKERFAIKKYLLIIGKKKNMQVLTHTFTYFST